MLHHPKVVVKAEEVKEADAIKSADQTSMKTITVTTNFDATASEVKLTRDSKAVATDSIQKAADGKTITINCSASLVEGTYVVTVGELSREIACEASKVDTIEFLSDKAAVVETATNYYGKATVGYRVLNQFKEDITKTTMLTVNASVQATLNSTDHQVVFYAPAGGTGFMLGRDMITCVLLDTNSGKNVSATLNCDMKAYAKTLTFVGIYNQDKKEITEDTNFDNDPFFMLFTAEDQYNQTYKNYKNVTEGTDIYLTVIGGLTAITRVPGQTFGTVEIDGEKYLSYPVAWDSSLVAANGKMAGTVSVQALSSGGASCSGTFEVGEGGRPVSVTAVAPAVVPAGEKTEIPYTALDATGKEVTSYKYMKEIDISGSTNVSFVRQADGSAKLILDATSGSLATVAKNNRTPVTFTMQTKNHKISTLTVYVTENAKPVAIDGLRDVDTSFDVNTKYVPIKLKNLKLEDQYGRVMSADAVATAAKRTTADAYQLKNVVATVVGTGADYVRLTANTSGGVATAGTPVPTGDLKWTTNTTVTASAILGNAGVSKNDILFLVTKSAGAVGFANINFAIDNGLSAPNVDSLNSTNANVQFNVKDTGKIDAATVEVKDIYVPATTDKVGTNAVYKQKVTVKANGVLLPINSYSIENSDDFTVTTDTSDGTTVYAIYATNNQNAYAEFTGTNKKDTITKQITITLNGSGEKIVQDVVMSSVAPKVAAVNLKEGKDDHQVVGLPGSMGPVSNGAIILACLDNVKDQYGVKLNLSVTNAAVTAGPGYTQQVYQYSFANEASPVSKSAVVTFIGANDSDDQIVLYDNGYSTATMTTYDTSTDYFPGITMEINFGGIKQQIKLHR